MNILVIGADKGLGAILTYLLHKAGHNTAAGYYDLSAFWKVTKTAGESGDVCDGILRLQMDVTSEDELAAAAGVLQEKMGKLDAVVDVAGILLQSDRDETLLTQSISDIRMHMEVNALGLVAAFRTMLPIMAEGSRFYAVTSEGGSFTLAGTLFPAYSVSKTAANKFVQVLRLTMAEEGRNGVDLVAVHPGRMNTEMGRTTAQIEPETAAEGFLSLIEGRTKIDSSKNWFVDYLGNPMPV